MNNYVPTGKSVARDVDQAASESCEWQHLLNDDFKMGLCFARI